MVTKPYSVDNARASPIRLAANGANHSFRNSMESAVYELVNSFSSHMSYAVATEDA